MNAPQSVSCFVGGLPDHVFLSRKTGKPDETMLRRAVGIPNRTSANKMLSYIKNHLAPKVPACKKLTGGDSALIDYYANPGIRLYLLRLAFTHYLQEQEHIKAPSHITGPAPSWELEVFNAYAKDILCDKMTYQRDVDTLPYTPVDALQVMLEDSVIRHLCQACSLIRERADMDLAKHWHALSPAQREQLASVVMALAQVFGASYLRSVFRLHPEMETYFSESIARGLLTLQDPAPVSPAPEPSATASSLLFDQPSVMTQDWWESHLHAALDRMLLQPADDQLASALNEALVNYRVWAASHVGAEQAGRIIESITRRIGEILAQFDIDHFLADRPHSDYSALLSQWMLWAHRLQPKDPAELQSLCEAWLAQLNGGISNVQGAQRDITVSRQALELAESSLPSASGLLASRRIKQQILEASAAIEAARERLGAHENALIESALPPGTPLSHLEQAQDVGPPPPGWPPAGLLDALQTLMAALPLQQSEQAPLAATEVHTAPPPTDDLMQTQPVDEPPREPIESTDSVASLLPLPAPEVATAPVASETQDDEPPAPEPDLTAHPEVDAEIEPDPASAANPEPPIETPTQPALPVVDTQVSAAPQADTEEGQRCIEYLLTDMFVPGEHLNAVIVHLVSEHQLPKAAQIAYIMGTSGLSSDFLPYYLIKAAYYGMNTYGMSSLGRITFDKARRQLLALQKSDIESWLDQSSGELVPYLLLLATFQPALFGGNLSTAVMLMRDLPESLFDHHTQSLINDIIDLANRGEPITPSHLLPADAGKNSREPVKFDTRKVSFWEQKIREARRGYAPVLKSLAYCLDHGVFHRITRIILADERQRHGEVESFVDTYRDREASNALLNDMLLAINMASVDSITRIGKERFHHKVLELVYIAQEWLETAVSAKGTAQEDFSKRFHTRLNHAIGHFQAVSLDEQQSTARRAGASVVAYSLAQLKERLGNPDHAWSYPRIKGWYYLPRDVISLCLPEAEESSVGAALWLLERLGRDLCSQDTLSLALQHQKLRLVELLKLHLQDAGEPVAHIDTHALFQALQQNLRAQDLKLQAKLENALLAALIDSARAEVLSGQLADSLDAIENLSIMDDVDDLRAHFDEIDQELNERLISIKRELRQRCDASMQALREAVPVDPVPTQWEQDLEYAFANDNIPVVWEMLDELSSAARHGRRIEFATIKQVPALQDFVGLEETIYHGVVTALKEGKHGLRHAVTQNPEERFGLQFGTISLAFRRAMDALSQWNNSKPKSMIDQEMYNDLCAILAMLGINRSDQQFNGQLKANVRYQTATGFASLRMPIAFSQSTRPFAIFGDKTRSGGHLQVMIAYMPWQPQNLSELKASHAIHEDALLISAVPLSPSQRQEFAQHFKRKQQMVLHVDMVTLLFLAAQEQSSIENIAVRNFLWLAAPYTYFNPYGGDTLRPPLPEMRYGREHQVQQLLNMDGAAIVYGGRQLGKSTILQEVQLRFNQPEQNKYAFYGMLDRDLDRRMDVSKEAHDKARGIIWHFMYNSMMEAGLIKRTSIAPNIDECMRIVKQTIIDDKKSSFIVIFDEIDPILNVDSNHDFSIFRGLRDLVANHAVAGRFKVIIGGLENVKRFENSPNYPLTQMGTTIQVEIMPTQEAIHLVTEPMLAAGYRFADVHAINHILAITNRHPGLLQAFCSELINYLSVNRQQSVGTCIITDADVESIGRKPEVRALIRKRFDMTLNLDARYLVIIYGIIDDLHGAQPFTVEYAKGIAEVWLPAAFRSLSKHQFEAFLEELVGLGVLRKNDDGHYALRNTNVLKLLVDIKENDVSHRLEMAIRTYNSFDPLDRHAYDPGHHEAPSPITYRDERAVIGLSADREGPATDSPLWRTPASPYTTTLVVGSRAQGIAQLENTLPSIYEEEDLRRFSGTVNRQTYIPTVVQSAQYSSPVDFEKRLLSPLVTTKSKRQPQMAFVRVGGETTIAHLLGLLDAAHGFAGQCIKGHYPVRILFLLEPAAYWNWVSHEQITRQRESLQALIKLTNWSGGAISALLGRIGMNDTSEVVEKLLTTCQGWYHTLHVIASTRKQHRDWVDIEQFTTFVPLIEMNQKQSEKFLKLTGIHDVAWARPVLTLLTTAGRTFDRDDFQLYAEEACGEPVAEEDAAIRLRWLLDMGLVISVPGAHLKATHYAVAPAVAHALNMVTTHDPSLA